MRAEDFFARKAAEDPAFKAAWDDESPVSVLALNVYRLRKERGLTQADLGKRAGLSQPKVAKIESGDANPELRTLGRLAGALGITVGELLTDPYEEKAGNTPEVHRETLTIYELPSLRPSGWDGATVAGVFRRTKGLGATVAANENFALAG
jgi:transcriptional regulator with XRE-family HTH domain